MLADITGTTLYYCSLSVQAEKRAHYISAQLICHTIMRVAERYKEHTVAHSKLCWWQKEIERLKSGTPTHPLSQSLQNYADQQTLIKTLTSIVDCAFVALETTSFTTKNELYQHYQHSGGLTEVIKAQICLARPLNALERNAAFQVGIGLEIIRHINLTAEHQHRNVNYCPCSYCELAVDAKQKLTYAKHLPRAHRINAAIALKLLKKIERNHFQLASHRYLLSPLQKLFTAWLTR